MDQGRETTCILCTAGSRTNTGRSPGASSCILCPAGQTTLSSRVSSCSVDGVQHEVIITGKVSFDESRERVDKIKSGMTRAYAQVLKVDDSQVSVDILPDGSARRTQILLQRNSYMRSLATQTMLVTVTVFADTPEQAQVVKTAVGSDNLARENFSIKIRQQLLDEEQVELFELVVHAAKMKTLTIDLPPLPTSALPTSGPFHDH